VCWLMQADLYNGHKTVACCCVYVCLQELAADQQLSRAALKQSGMASAGGGGSYELQSLADSPRKPPVIALDPLSQLSTTVTHGSSVGSDISSQQAQP